MTAECIFAAELVCQVLYHSDPWDMVRWQSVSKWFRTITSDAMLWKTLYKNAPFPRPPGPFPSQSTQTLQRALVKSAQLAQSWMTRPMRDLSSIKTHLKGEPGTVHKIICGRWLIACESERRFLLHDVNSGAETRTPQVLWEEKESRVSSWDMCWMLSSEGQCAVYVLCQLPDSKWKLLEFLLNSQSGELHHSASTDTRASKFDTRVELNGGKSPLLFIPLSRGRLVFDTRTRVFYKLPMFRPALDETRHMYQPYDPEDSPPESWVALTDTHVICFYHFYALLRHWDAVIQVFALGSPVKNGSRVLRLTHEGVADVELMHLEVLKSVVDPVTGNTNLRLLDYCIHHDDIQVTRIDLILPEPSAVGVLPMVIETQRVGFPKNDVLANRYVSRLLYVDVSDEDHVRGFFRGIPRQDFLDMENDHIMKFAIDTAQDPWVATCGKLSPAEWNHIEDSWVDDDITFDGMRGKLCFADPRNYKTIVVVDIE